MKYTVEEIKGMSDEKFKSKADVLFDNHSEKMKEINVVEVGEIYRHKRKKTAYCVDMVANMDCDWPTMVVYSEPYSEKIYARPLTEFVDKFEYL